MAETLGDPPSSPYSSPSRSPSPSPPSEPAIDGSPSPPHEPSRPPPSSSRKPAGKKRKHLSVKQRTAVEKRFSVLQQSLIPKPFLPSRDNIDRPRLLPLLDALGLRSFVEFSLPTEIRRDILMELIAHYDLHNRRSSVFDSRITLSRASLAHALSLPVKRPPTVDPEEPLCSLFASEASSIRSFMMHWMILGDEMMYPVSVQTAIELVESGQAWKVDWAGLLLAMVEKDLVEAQTSGVCYYASHLQQLVVFQKPAIFQAEFHLFPQVPCVEEELQEAVEAIVDAGNVVDVNVVVVAEQSVTATSNAAGADVVAEQPVMAIDSEAGEEEEEEDGGGGIADVVNGEGERNQDVRLMPCTMEHVLSVERVDTCKGEDADVVEEALVKEDAATCKDEFVSRLPSFSGQNDTIIRDLEVGNDPFCSSMPAGLPEELLGSNEQDRNMMEVDFDGGPPFFQNNGKRVGSDVGEGDDDGEDDDEVHRFSDQQPQKRQRTEVWARTSVYASLTQASTWIERAKLESQQKEQEFMELQMQLHCLTGAIQQKDQMIEALERVRLNENHKRLMENRHYQQEHAVMSSLVLGYQKALRETREAFAEYRKRFPQGEEPIYNDVSGPGGTVLSVREIERRRREMLELENQRLKKRETDNHAVVREVLNFIDFWSRKFESYHHGVEILESKLNNIAEERNHLGDRICKVKSFLVDDGGCQEAKISVHEVVEKTMNVVDGDKSSALVDGFLEEKSEMLEDGADGCMSAIPVEGGSLWTCNQ